MSTPKHLSCDACGCAICGRQAVVSRILGGLSVRRCLPCLSAGLAMSADEILDRAGNYLARRDCYRRDWCTARTCGQDGQSPCCPSRIENAPDQPRWYDPELFGG